MPSANVAEKIEQFLKCDTSETTLDQHASAEYQAQFSDEGARKAAYIVNDLQQNSIATGEALDNFCYLSIGGADGSEIEAILTQTDIRYGILIEKSNDARRAAERRKKTLEKTGRHLFLYTGDATQSLVDDALPTLQSLKKDVGISGVVVSMQAVIHELPTRSPAFKSPSGQDEVFYFNNFIAKCFKNFEKRAFYCREPTPPDNWPDFVELRIPSVAGDRLTVFSSFIAQKLGLIDTLPEEFPDDFVQMPKTLALEVVQKLRCPNVSRFKFELGERLTTYAPSELQSIIDKFLPHGNAVLEPHVSDGFKAFWGQLGIEARSTKGQGQPIPSTHARIMSFSVPPRRTEIQPDAEPPRQSRQTSQQERFSARISQDFLVAKRDNSPYSRRQALTQLIDQLAEVNRKDYEYFLVRSKILRHMFLEARNISEQASAIEHSRNGILELLDLAGQDNTDEQAVLLAADWAVDVSQRADSFAALNNLLQALNAAVSALSRQVGPSGQVGANPASRATLLAKRAKSRRALASLKRRRGDKRMRAESDGLMAAALKDAERAYDISETHQTRFELALSLIATARVYDSEEAERGITLLRIAFESGPQIFAGYELTRQLRRRHRYKEAVAVFRLPAELDDDEPRFHANLQPFADSVIGLYYDENRDGVAREARQHAVIACKWLEESISQQHHKAKDVVDYCFCKVIAGFSAEEAVEPLKWLRPESSSTWDELVEISRRIAAGDKSAGEGLLLGFDDASVWGRIGTFYSDFLNDYPQAISFYKRASLVDAGSPVYHLNMARVAADRMNDFPSARAYLNQAKARRQNRWNWSKQNSTSFKEIDALLKRNNA